MKRHGRRPQINKIPGQEFALEVELKKALIATGEESGAAGECTCAVDDIYWYNETTGEYDLLSLTLFDVPSDDDMPKAALVGDTCPGMKTNITATFSPAGDVSVTTKWEIVQEGQVWALVMTEVTQSGTLDVSGTVTCNGEVTNVATTLTISLEPSGEG